MKIKHKILPILSICGLSVSPLTITTSCSCVFELNLTEHEQYIYDRTFSIMGNNGGSYIFGTGWIVADATKDVFTDYKYYLATNWHVTKAFKDIKSIQYYYADNSLTYNSEYVDYSRYLPFAINGFIIEDDKNFIYEPQPIGGHINAIDLSVVQVNFGSPTGAIKEKLDRLNECQKNNGYINKFAKDSPEIRAKNKIIGGYPKIPRGVEKASTFGGKWEAHSFASSNLGFYDKYYKYDGVNQGHCIGNDDYPYWDVSPQYMFKKSMGKDFMSEGSSGSMMITQDYEVCGIYWGGWTSGEAFYPSFSLFNTEDKNFLEKYTK